MEDGSSHRESRSSQSNSSKFLPLLGSSLVCGAWPRGARRLPLAAPGRLAAGLSPPQSCPSLRAFARAAAEPPAVPPGWLGPGLLGACACLPAAADNRRRPRAPARRPVPGRASRELGAPPPAAAPAPWVPPNPRCGDADAAMRDMDGPWQWLPRFSLVSCC